MPLITSQHVKCNYSIPYLTRFCNETLKAIEYIEKLIRVDPRKNLNEQLIANLMSFYDIQFPFPHQQKQTLAVIITANYNNCRSTAASKPRTT